MPSDGLKVCTFNAKCDQIDYKCCARVPCSTGCHGSKHDLPDSLAAALIAVAILPNKADIYNIQNVQNRCVVEHLLKEIARVKNIIDMHSDDIRSLQTEYMSKGVESAQSIVSNPLFMQIVCKLNDMTGLCEDAERVKEALAQCGYCGINYVDIQHLYNQPIARAIGDSDLLALVQQFLSYTGVTEYNAYYNGTCLTLVKKSLCIVPETKEIPCVDSLVLLFEHNSRKFINVNLNVGCLVNKFEDIGCQKTKIDNIVAFLKKYSDCGQVIMTGAFGDIDYDIPQLLFRDDAQMPIAAQQVTSRVIKLNPVPSDFPCDLSDPLYDILELLLKSCKGEQIPYSWLLQYLRLKNGKRSNLYKLLPKRCQPGCVKECCRVVKNLQDCKRCPDTPDLYVECGNNRAQMRQAKLRADRVKKSSVNDCNDRKSSCSGQNASQRAHTDRCNKPACVSAKKCCCQPKIEKPMCSSCNVPSGACRCEQSRCEIRCRAPTVCKCDKSRHRINVDTCRDLCRSCNKKTCCDSCSKGGRCDGDSGCRDPCDDIKYCDPISVLKRELCLYNSLNNIRDVNNRYTGYYNHYNRCLDCKYPRGMFQAWAMCEEYEKPCKSDRVVNSNSELLALDHFLVSDCLKSNISMATLSNMCIESTCVGLGTESYPDASQAFPYVLYESEGSEGGKGGKGGKGGGLVGPGYVTQYAGRVVKSVFTHRVYCVTFDFPHIKKGCDVGCGESLHGLGLIGLWSALCSAGCDSVDISVFKKFGLDKHPYFRSFFWDSINQHSFISSSDDANPAFLYARLSKPCNDNSLISIQRRSCISEEEFYSHLLCVLSNEDSRDRFIMTVAIIESFYKIDKMKTLLETNPNLHYLYEDDHETVNNLLLVISSCFANNLRIAENIDGFDTPNLFGWERCESGTNFAQMVKETAMAQLIGSINIDNVYNLMRLLSVNLIDNCVFMEILCRRGYGSIVQLVEVLKQGDPEESLLGALGTIINNTIGSGATDLLISIVQDFYVGLSCGSVCKQVTETLGVDAVLFFLLLIGGAQENPLVLGIEPDIE